MRHAKSLLSEVMRHAVEAGAIGDNPVSGITVPRGQPTPRRTPAWDERWGMPRTIPWAQVAALLAAVPRPEDALLIELIELIVACRLRFSEATALRRGDVDLIGHRVRVERTLSCAGGQQAFEAVKRPEDRRAVYVPSPAFGKLSAHVRALPSEPELLLFTGERGNAWWLSGFTRSV
ncbi:MAG: hypothetical protein ACJ74O_15960 [Frankiaceae bacterium]